MKRKIYLVLALSCSLLAATPGWASAKAAPAAKSPGLELAAVLTQVTGIAISPLLGVAAVGAYKYFQADTPEEHAKLPWYAQVTFWLPALILVAVCACKDSIAAALPPGLKKPVDAAEVLENKLSGLVAAGAVIPDLVDTASKFLAHTSALDHHATLAGGFGLVQLGAFDLSWVLNLLMVPLAVAMYGIVWVVGHAINVLILLSPWGGLDTALKAMRTGVLSLVVATAYIDPVVGATLSAVIVLGSYFVAGWAFRLMVYGSEFSWDFFTLRHRRFAVLADGNKLFTAREIAGAPLRTYGRLYQEAGGRLTFRFRPWLVLPERVIEIPREGLVVGRGVFSSEVLGYDKLADKNATLLLLPPRYLGHEELFARTYHISGTCEVGLRRAWSWIREAFGWRARPQPVAA
jgi:hypothetical protein